MVLIIHGAVRHTNRPRRPPRVPVEGAFFNLDLLSFEIAEGRTTTLEVHPTIQSESTFLLKFFVPQLLAP